MSQSASARRKVFRLSGERRVVDIMKAAREVFSEKGYDEAALSGIAERADVVLRLAWPSVLSWPRPTRSRHCCRIRSVLLSKSRRNRQSAARLMGARTYGSSSKGE
jgi:hypothetical protein